MNMKQLFLFIAIFSSSLSFTQNETLFEEANALYNSENYHEALDRYKTIVESGEHSASLYFNIGNAHYKLNHIAPSIYYYEKALLLKPNDAEIRNNLAYARNMTLDAIDTVPEVGFSGLFNKWASYFHYEVWAKITVGLAVFFVILFIAYYFSYSTTKKRIAFMMSTLCFLLACIALSLTFHGENLVERNQPAIVFAKESQIKSEPNLRSTEAFKLHEGTKVQVLDTVNNWKKIKISDGKTGWVMSEDIKLVKIF